MRDKPRIDCCHFLESTAIAKFKKKFSDKQLQSDTVGLDIRTAHVAGVSQRSSVNVLPRNVSGPCKMLQFTVASFDYDLSSPLGALHASQVNKGLQYPDAKKTKCT